MQEQLEIQYAQLKTMYSLAMTVEARDSYTGGHLWRVSQLSRALAENLHLPEEEVIMIGLAGFMHDLGKIGVPDEVLNKQGPLTEEEYNIIKTHPRVGADLLKDHPLVKLVIDGVYAHHERPDGKGYPKQLKEGEISVMASIVAITDAFDAMTSTRPYRAGMSIAKALQIISENLGTQFDSKIGSSFIEMGQRGELNHIVGHSEPGIPLIPCPACGPIIVKATCYDPETNTIVCPACTGKFKALSKKDHSQLEFTGEYDRVRAKELRIDHILIDDMIKNINLGVLPHLSHS